MALNEEQHIAVELAGDVKHKLVEFALSAPLARHLRKCLRELEADYTSAQDAGEAAVEKLLFEYQFDDGTTVIDRFVRKVHLSEPEHEMALGFGNGVDSFFEALTDIPEPATDFKVRCCISELEHTVAPTMAGGMPHFPPGTFMVGRLNPVAGTELWTPSGSMEMHPQSTRNTIVEAVRGLVVQQPWRTHRNPEKYRKAIDKSQALHQAFLERHCSDMVSTDGKGLADIYGDALVSEARSPEVAASGRIMARESIEESDLADAVQVTVHSHPIGGFGFHRDFIAVERALRDGEKASSEDLDIVRAYLEDPATPQWFLQQIIVEHLPTSEKAVAQAIGRASFNWDRDGDQLLSSYPGDPEPVLTIGIMPSWIKE